MRADGSKAPGQGASLALEAAVAAVLVAVPALGAALAGRDIASYLRFPPTTVAVAGRLPFSTVAFALGSVAAVVTVAAFVWVLARPTPEERDRAGTARRFPWWGWAGLAFGVLAWTLAWTRMAWFAPLQPFTFTPQWLSYIVVVNALRYRLQGRCMLLDRPRYLAGLFAASAVFWWYFEYLNRFVQNWHYVGIEELSGPQYFIRATLPFATVLPAVMGTFELLDATRLGPRAERFAGTRLSSAARPIAVVTLAVGLGGLAGIAAWPRLLFPLVWFAPALILGSTTVLAGRAPTAVTTSLSRRLVLLPLAALVCGFFWEMWNAYSQARWTYQVPWVGRFHLFEMPVLGYLGYLTFGWECGLIASWVGSRLDLRLSPADVRE